MPVETTGCMHFYSYPVRGAGNLQLQWRQPWPTDEWQRWSWLAAAAAANRVHATRVTGAVKQVTSCSNYRSLPVVTSACLPRSMYPACSGLVTPGSGPLLQIPQLAPGWRQSMGAHELLSLSVPGCEAIVWDVIQRCVLYIDLYFTKLIRFQITLWLIVLIASFFASICSFTTL